MMERVTIDRRSLLSSASFAAAVVALPLGHAASAAETADRTPWNFALATHKRLKVESDAFSEKYAVILERCEAAVGRIPHVTLRPDPYTGRAEPVSTADERAVRQARRDVDDMDRGRLRIDPGTPGVADHYQLQRELAQAADDRDAAIERVRASFDMDELDAEWERRGDRLDEAEKTLMGIPAPDLAALRWKIDNVIGEGTRSWSAGYVAQMLADIARLLPATDAL